MTYYKIVYRNPDGKLLSALEDVRAAGLGKTYHDGKQPIRVDEGMVFDSVDRAGAFRSNLPEEWDLSLWECEVEDCERIDLVLPDGLLGCAQRSPDISSLDYEGLMGEWTYESFSRYIQQPRKAPEPMFASEGTYLAHGIVLTKPVEERKFPSR